jgi:hypothetical protein
MADNTTLSNNNFTQNLPKLFVCNFCDFKCCNKKDWNRHLITNKHLKRCNDNENNRNDDVKISKNNKPSYVCEICEKHYISASGIWRHKKKCNIEAIGIKINNNTETIKEETKIKENEYSDREEIKLLTHMFLELVKQNSEFKELLVEQNKQNQSLQNQFIELAKDKSITNNTNNTNNSHNTTNNTHFNLQLFLNETCKNAMNINDFIDRIQVTINDLENTGRLGYVEGITRIFINGLKELEVNERPIHCSDAKRETLYIKDGDIWEKDDINKTKLQRQ